MEQFFFCARLHRCDKSDAFAIICFVTEIRAKNFCRSMVNVACLLVCSSFFFSRLTFL